MDRIEVHINERLGISSTKFKASATMGPFSVHVTCVHDSKARLRSCKRVSTASVYRAINRTLQISRGKQSDHIEYL